MHVVTRLQEATRGLGEKDNHPIPTEHSERPSAPAPLAVVQPGVAVACTLPDGVGHVLDRAERAVRVRLVDPAHHARRLGALFLEPGAQQKSHDGPRTAVAKFVPVIVKHPQKPPALYWKAMADGCSTHCWAQSHRPVA